MCQALVLWDCKMAMLNTLLFNYITLEDIVLEATGAVAETPAGFISLLCLSRRTVFKNLKL
jgi:hypothetical protein